jgi:hypothetical protein
VSIARHMCTIVGGHQQDCLFPYICVLRIRSDIAPRQDSHNMPSCKVFIRACTFHHASRVWQLFVQTQQCSPTKPTSSEYATPTQRGTNIALCDPTHKNNVGTCGLKLRGKRHLRHEEAEAAGQVENWLGYIHHIATTL